ncbi:hypothetical protein CPLU01_10834 [Colletotrichum plurivorum]|uniref:Uncharacterized protein n=1 Tax=Colletotrichum plurivorum TaxID=2175906 RepID=A0A8H6N8Q1_9PEZI|nr:hypothetical protein CPLU01_10834 [Colletotrichum plurivorum]
MTTTTTTERFGTYSLRTESLGPSPLPPISRYTTTTTTTTTTTVAVPPECGVTPHVYYPFHSTADCHYLSLAPEQACPTGWTKACEDIMHSSEHWESGKPTFMPAADGTTYEVEVFQTWSTEYVRLVCCPTILDYKCGNNKLVGPECSAYVPSPTVIPFHLPSQPPSSVELTSADDYYGFPVTGSYARVSLAGLSYRPSLRPPVSLTGEPTTTWCTSLSCYDLARTFTTAGDAAATLVPAPEYTQRPPPEMGRLGSVGLFAVSVLAAAVLSAAGMLTPWAWAYQQRRRQQRVAQ